MSTKKKAKNGDEGYPKQMLQRCLLFVKKSQIKT